MLQYNIIPQPQAHQWHICLQLEQNTNTSLHLSLPNWVPGSYLIRDFSRHITAIKAICNGQNAEIRQTDKNHWQTEALAGTWQICYTVYAYDLSVRGSYLSNERGFFDGACLFLSIENHEHELHQITFNQLPEHWQTATTLPQSGGFSFQTASYAELIDHPVELGYIETLHFDARGIPHRIAISGHYTDFDRARLLTDIQKICSAQLAMFPEPAPFAEYLFLLHVGDNIYGGLEHRSSTALLADRNALPSYGMGETDDAYTQLLGLFSHEYFHAWNVKSIKPAAFAPYQLNHESYTEQLWVFEGITSYYDDLFLVRSGVITPKAYLQQLAKTLTRVQQGKGRLKQTLAESSFCAWHKFYKQDENSPNSIVSYYQKGALAALCLDLLIRQKSRGAHSLDSVMQQLYRDWLASCKGISEQQWQVRCQAITGLDLHEFFQTALYSTRDLPLIECLCSAGIVLKWQAEARSHGGALVDSIDTAPVAATDFGARYTQNSDSITLSHVFNDGSAEQAGLCPHDRIIAINGFTCNAFDKQWAAFTEGEQIQLHYFRYGVLQQTSLTVQNAAADTALLCIVEADLLTQWLQVD